MLLHTTGGPENFLTFPGFSMLIWDVLTFRVFRHFSTGFFGFTAVRRRFDFLTFRVSWHFSGLFGTFGIFDFRGPLNFSTFRLSTFRTKWPQKQLFEVSGFGLFGQFVFLRLNPSTAARNCRFADGFNALPTKELLGGERRLASLAT